MMKSLMRQCGRLGWLWFLAGVLPVFAAGEPDSATDRFTADSLFEAGRLEFTVNSGFMISPFLARQNRPILDYTLSEVQFGYMLSNIHEAGWLRGNFELVGDLFGGAVFEGKGNALGGLTAWLRYNFVPLRNARLIPYFQAGAGPTLLDVNRYLLGESFNFNLNFGAGIRYLFSEHWALDLEFRYQHISNANLSSRNIGINANGALLGISYLF